MAFFSRFSSSTVPAPLYEAEEGVPAGKSVHVGVFLREVRESCGYSVQDVSEELKIRKNYIVAIEEMRLHLELHMAYTLGFVRGYAAFLGLDPHTVGSRYREESLATGAPARRKSGIRPVAADDRPAGTVRAILVLLAFSPVVLAMALFGEFGRSTPAQQTAALPSPGGDAFVPDGQGEFRAAGSSAFFPVLSESYRGVRFLRLPPPAEVAAGRAGTVPATAARTGPVVQTPVVVQTQAAPAPVVQAASYVSGRE